MKKNDFLWICAVATTILLIVGALLNNNFLAVPSVILTLVFGFWAMYEEDKQR